MFTKIKREFEFNAVFNSVIWNYYIIFSSGLIFALDSSSAAPPLYLTNSALTATFRGDSSPWDDYGNQCGCLDHCAPLPEVRGNVAIHRGQYYWEVDVCNSAIYRIGKYAYWA